MYTLHIKDYFTCANTEEIERTELDESPLGVEASEPPLPPGSKRIAATLRRTSAERPHENDMHVPDGLSLPPSEVSASGNIVPQETASADRIKNHRHGSSSSSASTGSLSGSSSGYEADELAEQSSGTKYRDIEKCPKCGNAVQHNQQWFTATTNTENGILYGRILYCSEQCAKFDREDDEVVRPIRFLFKRCPVRLDDNIWMPVAVCNKCHNYTCCRCLMRMLKVSKDWKCPLCRCELCRVVNLMPLRDTSQIQNLATPSNPPDVASLTMDESPEQIGDASGDAIEVNQQDDDMEVNQDDGIVHHAENPGNTDLANPDDDGFEDGEGNEDN